MQGNRWCFWTSPVQGAVAHRERSPPQQPEPWRHPAQTTPPASQRLVLEDSGSQIQGEDACFTFLRGPSSGQCRAANGVGGGQRWRAVTEKTPGGRGTRLLTAEWTFLGPQVYAAPASEAPAPGWLTGILVLSQAGVGPHLSKNSPHVLRVPPRRSLLRPPICTWLCTSQSTFPPLFPPFLTGRAARREGYPMFTSPRSRVTELRPPEVEKVRCSTQRVQAWETL